MKNVLIVNQSAELYGADKALLELIEHYPDGYNPIVVLHQDGPLKNRLESLGVQVIRSSVVKVKRGVLTPKFFLKLPFDVFTSIRKIRKELNGKEIHLVHSNAISVFIGAFYSFIFRRKHLWHVHEIIEHPKMLAYFYPKIVSLFSTHILFNSNATSLQFQKMKKGLERKSTIVHNGQNRVQPISSAEEIRSIRTDLFRMKDPNHLVIGLVGRVSRLKGQGVLLKAFVQLCQKYDSIHLVYVGSAPDGQEQFLENLHHKIEAAQLEAKVTVVDFQENIWPVYDALDIAVVPSTEPESFGLVATEAMLSRKPVVASRLGGLQEIIVEGHTGFLVMPKNATELAEKLETFIAHPEKIREFGENGYEVVIKNFSTEKYIGGVKDEYEKLTP
ncbi:glycosyltransferase family 4 protein [Flavobacterium sp. MAH-1]|uniref:Glycosyltransferase family 4 protein n=1 Tax=Flavobacterium agri TaxID=2743471 RepID=A0A7Y8Y0H6_9FLAO|nr:glycosyltransferase family 4 protein [Flavobacterium agri]NUY80140.1 glycosyltransferase family 4 protein [Flavobacterium agri]NYA70165.1 glycosyltransferase family 4 protein [Flavobacterium agri]